MAVVDRLEEPERRLDPVAKLAVGGRPDKLPAGPAGNETDLPEPVEGQELVREQADHRPRVVAAGAAAYGLGPGIVGLGAQSRGQAFDLRGPARTRAAAPDASAAGR